VSGSGAVHAELELKAVVPDPEALVARLLAAGAAPTFRGELLDRRYDRGDELARRDEVLRVRTWRADDGTERAELGWKGPTRRSPEGYKLRDELECDVHPGAAGPGAILEALGYRAVHAVDRRVAVFALHGATARVEWYPRMDVLVEVEGAGKAIEAAIAATGIARGAFTADALRDFVARYEPRTGRRAAVSLAELGGAPAEWGP
jgi:adenylate cyclase class IV